MAGQDLDLTFLCKANWPLIPGQSTEQNKAIHEWCGQMSQVIEALYGRIQELEKTQTAQSDEVKKRVRILEENENKENIWNISYVFFPRQKTALFLKVGGVQIKNNSTTKVG
jgi:hypothetical protein